MDSMDWKAATNSEIFCEYVKNELLKEAKAEEQDKIAKANEPGNEELIRQFYALEEKVNSNPKLLSSFRAYKAKIMSDFAYLKKAEASNKLLVEAVMMMDLGEDDE
jgi:hypothetical protein